MVPLFRDGKYLSVSPRFGAQCDVGGCGLVAILEEVSSSCHLPSKYRRAPEQLVSCDLEDVNEKDVKIEKRIPSRDLERDKDYHNNNSKNGELTLWIPGTPISLGIHDSKKRHGEDMYFLKHNNSYINLDQVHCVELNGYPDNPESLKLIFGDRKTVMIINGAKEVERIMKVLTSRKNRV